MGQFIFKSFLLTFFSLFLFYKKVESLKGENIFGGETVNDTDFKYFEYHVILGRHDYRCNGAMLMGWHIVTAASCVFDENGNYRSNLKALSGINHYDEQVNPGREIFIKKVYVLKQFPRYNRTQYQYPLADIAVIKFQPDLKDFVKFMSWLNDNSRIVKDDINAVDTEITANVSGFGLVHLNTLDKYHSYDLPHIIKGYPSDKLQKATARVLPQTECVSENHLCAQIKRTPEQKMKKITAGVCDGDVGAPLVRDRTLIGVLSVPRPDCDESESPAMYTRVKSYIKDFISHVTMNAACNDDIMWCLDIN